MEPVDWLPAPLAYTLFWISQHQTLLAGGAAIVVGYLTIKAIRDQIRSDQQLREDERTRKVRAMKAGIPFALSRISEYTEECLRYLEGHLDKNGKFRESDGFDELFHPQEDSPSALSSSIYPHDAFDAVRVTIEFASLKEAEVLHLILSYAQIQHSQLMSTVAALSGRDTNAALTHRDVWRDIRDVIGLQKHAERLYAWARGTEDCIPPLCNAQEAAKSWWFRGLSSQEISAFIEHNWPPDFPRTTTPT